MVFWDRPSREGKPLPGLPRARILPHGPTPEAAMSRRGAGGGLSWFLPLLLLAPPAANVVWDFQRSRVRALAPPAGIEKVEDISGSAAAAEIASLRHLLDEKERALQVLRIWSQLPESRYEPVPADSIRFSDPSPRRSGLWIWAASIEGVNPRTAVVNTSPQALVGRVERAPSDRLLRVQTVQDRFFRVRFSYGGTGWGFLWGTGKVDDEKRPLLEIRHPGNEAPFREGDVALTDGSDGFYPKGIPIGTLVRIRPGDTEDCYLVRSFLSIEAIAEVVLLVDRAALEARRRAEQELRG
jgi:cell shape-determining protein MreC